MWTVCATAMAAFAMLAVGPAVRLIHRQAVSLNARTIAPKNRILRSFANLEHSGLLSPGLARQLMALSTARFAIQVLMAGQTAEAIGVHIPLWQLAAAMPFVIIACVIVVTPGGLGVNELSYATTLHLFGTPLNVGAQWALANRVLVASSCIVVAACAIAALGLTRMMSCRQASRWNAGRSAMMKPATSNGDTCSRCTVCGGDQWSFVRSGCDLYQPDDETSFKLDRCLSCGQVMQNPLPTPKQLSKAYSAEYAPYRPAWKQHGWPLWKILRELTTWRRMRRLQPLWSGDQIIGSWMRRR